MGEANFYYFTCLNLQVLEREMANSLAIVLVLATIAHLGSSRIMTGDWASKVCAAYYKASELGAFPPVPFLLSTRAVLGGMTRYAWPIHHFISNVSLSTASSSVRSVNVLPESSFITAPTRCGRRPAFPLISAILTSSVPIGLE